MRCTGRVTWELHAHVPPRMTVHLARAALPPSLQVVGMVYDVHTGLVKVIDPTTTG